MLANLQKNWKTTAAAIALFAVTVAFLMGRVTFEQYIGSFGAFAAAGFAAAGDGKQ